VTQIGRFRPLYRGATFCKLGGKWLSAFAHMNRIFRALTFILFLPTLTAGSVVSAADNKQVILLHSFGTDMRPWSDYARGIREELNRQSPWPLTITDQSVISARYNNNDSEKPFVDYLTALFAQHSPVAIVVVGAPAAAFVQRNRDQLFRSTPIVLTTLEERRIDYSSLTRNDAIVPIQIDYKAVIANILKVLPDTRRIAVVNGTSPNEKFWTDLIRKEAVSVSDRVEFTFWDNLPFKDILKDAARLPSHSAIIWEGMSVDAAGVVHDGDEAFKALRAASSAPIFGYTEPLIGQGVVGGPFDAVLDTSRTAAAVVVRILNGEKPGDIRMSPLPFAKPRFDWREVRRWGIAEDRLPLGSDIVFRDPTAWQQYRWHIFLVGVVVVLQAALISILLFERNRRRLAEVLALQRTAELAHINRYSIAGELTTAIAHELNQPLGAILTNAETAELLVKSAAPDLKEVAEILGDIRRDDKRASEVIDRLRALLRKEPLQFRRIDFNDVARETLHLLTAVASARKVDLASFIGQAPLPIRGEVVQLQQVILNLIVNAMDAVSDTSPADRRITIASKRDGKFAQLSVSDRGPGIHKETLKDLFNPFFTTKPHGMGMGLSIARTIVEAHDGQLIGENRTGGGAIFYVRIPFAAN
jgi:signal transduction histidine kinase